MLVLFKVYSKELVIALRIIIDPPRMPHSIYFCFADESRKLELVGFLPEANGLISCKLDAPKDDGAGGLFLHLCFCKICIQGAPHA